MKHSIEEIYQKVAKLKMRIIDVEHTEHGKFYKPMPAWDNFMNDYWLLPNDVCTTRSKALAKWFEQHGIWEPEDPGQIVQHVYFKSEQHMVEWILRWGA